MYPCPGDRDALHRVPRGGHPGDRARAAGERAGRPERRPARAPPALGAHDRLPRLEDHHVRGTPRAERELPPRAGHPTRARRSLRTGRIACPISRDSRGSTHRSCVPSARAKRWCWPSTARCSASSPTSSSCQLEALDAGSWPIVTLDLSQLEGHRIQAP
ncbi:MAG: hypothetical protein MZV64_25890 [Ignavibacteriales bacterium]|nr:hypothetical protein [Ignavibacteriales bacterium]